jgi:hypothetical protein
LLLTTLRNTWFACNLPLSHAGLYIGSLASLGFLEQLGITHVLVGSSPSPPICSDPGCSPGQQHEQVDNVRT